MPMARKSPLLPIEIAAVAVLCTACSRPSHDEHGNTNDGARVSYGAAMANLGRRFELFGRACVSGRFELAEYELGEIDEEFEGTLPHAEPPREGHPEVLPAMVTAFRQATVAELRRALTTRDRAQAATAFEHAAAACNACHQASGHGFIEIPLVAGRSIPNTDPISP